MPDPTSTYQGAPGGPRDPATPGPYCLLRCLCGTCPQYLPQVQRIQEIRDQEYAAVDREAGKRWAAQQKHVRKPKPKTTTPRRRAS